MTSLSLCALLLAALACHCHAAAAAAAAYRRPQAIGVNYGSLADDLPTATRSVKLLRKANAGAVKLYNADQRILHALAGTGIPVSVMVPNDLIPSLADSRAAARKWVANNLKRHPRVRVMYLLVGNELLSYPAIAASTWGKIDPLAMDALAASYPPSAGAFREDIAGTVMRPLLHFLNYTRSYYFVDAYPYFPWAANQKDISLDYALFEGNASSHYVDPATRLTYTNLLDQMLDACVAAMRKLGYGGVKLAISETGWPNAGDPGQAGANVRNAALYNRHLARRMHNNVGTPARPRSNMPVFVFSLYNENLKPGAGTERHWGMFYPNGTWVYQIDLTGRRTARSYPPLPPPDNKTAKLEWCVLAGGGKPVNETAVADALNYACQQGTGTCAAIQPGGACYEPNTLDAHASYAFNAYWQQFKGTGGSCYFNGLAVKTNKDPSYGSCKFPSS
ncbi:hypothetical protein ZWY2020_048437 [Hordeum vulgare]|nr:hypothetical protein ZWY2020_048437 [Hordeum vulgare]